MPDSEYRCKLIQHFNRTPNVYHFHAVAASRLCLSDFLQEVFFSDHTKPFVEMPAATNTIVAPRTEVIGFVQQTLGGIMTDIMTLTDRRQHEDAAALVETCQLLCSDMGRLVNAKAEYVIFDNIIP